MIGMEHFNRKPSMTTATRPDFVPSGAVLMPFSELSARHEQIKPKTRSRVRVSFDYLRFTPRGEIKTIGDGRLTLIQGKIHPKVYAFDGTDKHLEAGSSCWVWTLDDERAEQERCELPQAA